MNNFINGPTCHVFIVKSVKQVVIIVITLDIPEINVAAIIVIMFKQDSVCIITTFPQSKSLSQKKKSDFLTGD